MANGIRQQIVDLERDHLRRTEQERSDQANNVASFGEKLERSNAEFDSASRRANDATVDHLAAVNRLKTQADERIREGNAMHMETVKETRKANARELDSHRNAAETKEKNLIEYQSAEKQKAEEARRQLNKESAEIIAMELQETARARDIADQQEKERIEFKHRVEQNNMESVKEMKTLLLQNAERENARKIQHVNELNAISTIGVVESMKMETAQHQMHKTRSALDDVEKVSDELNTLSRKFIELSGKLGLAFRLKNVDMLRRNYVMISRNLESIKTSRESSYRLLKNLLTLKIDDKNEERTLIFSELMEEIQKLNDLHSVLTELMPTAQDDFPISHMDVMSEELEKAKGVIESIKTIWNNRPPIDRTNLIHDQLMRTTEMVLNGGSLQAQVKGLNISELEDQDAQNGQDAQHEN